MYVILLLDKKIKREGKKRGLLCVYYYYREYTHTHTRTRNSRARVREDGIELVVDPGGPPRTRPAALAGPFTLPVDTAATCHVLACVVVVVVVVAGLIAAAPVGGNGRRFPV